MQERKRKNVHATCDGVPGLENCPPEIVPAGNTVTLCCAGPGSSSGNGHTSTREMFRRPVGNSPGKLHGGCSAKTSSGCTAAAPRMRTLARMRRRAGPVRVRALAEERRARRRASR
eukprot:CAMPEP_0204584980 /NCGR_PEP_ID=MMETSP0661-20131031/46653_1 /ASSEMBLY_ACC=CAM_ASM_000606 /TAXON_ID=109239 /ORGANISM="Alexandrium margalefi, Strain AMGDE01CS-322" /LENGTH=115 /DNA_ID=CAMNT_0051594485 /DNA_START=68 /DNA_END=412 /DNA_ORIENTATION=-